MKKSALFILLVFLLVSCQSSPKTESLAVVTKTPILEKSTESPAPKQSDTPVPPSPTATDFPYNSNINVFPLKVTDGTFDFECVADFDNMVLKHYKIPDGTVVKYWVTCEDGGVQFLLPLFIENSTMLYPLIANAPASKMGKTYEFSDESVKKMVQNGLDILKASGKTKVKIVGGNNSSMILRIDDPYPAIFQTTGWDKAMIEFAQTGNPSVLPEISGLSGKLIFGYRIEIVKE